MRTRFASACALATLFALVPLSSFTAAQAQTTPQVHVERDHVRISNLEPGAQIVLFSCAKYVKRGTLYSDPQARLLGDDDSDGVITLASDVPNASVWVAVEFRTGTVAAGALPGFGLTVREIGETLYRKDADEQIIGLERSIPRLQVLLVRPKQGAWGLRVREGGPGDSDGEANGRMRISFEDAQPIPGGKEQAPRHLKAGDVVIAIDPGHLDVFVGQVTK